MRDRGGPRKYRGLCLANWTPTKTFYRRTSAVRAGDQVTLSTPENLGATHGHGLAQGTTFLGRLGLSCPLADEEEDRLLS